MPDRHLPLLVTARVDEEVHRRCGKTCFALLEGGSTFTGLNAYCRAFPVDDETPRRLTTVEIVGERGTASYYVVRCDPCLAAERAAKEKSK